MPQASLCKLHADTPLCVPCRTAQQQGGPTAALTGSSDEVPDMDDVPGIDDHTLAEEDDEVSTVLHYITVKHGYQLEGVHWY